MFEGVAEEAIRFYVSLFADAEITTMERYEAGEAGEEGTVKRAAFVIKGQEFMAFDSAIKHGFTFTPSISLFVQCETGEEIDRLYGKLSDGGQALMPLGNYGFSEKFGWISDRFGVSWQLNLEAK
jgi:predicted 3-demethylubiquinone-9 3-methyltransferase (glyoxalase superfamily)